MTDQQPPTPSIELLSQWCEDWNPNDAFLAEHVAMQAVLWGWQQRDASVADELQKARDEELEACCEWVKAKEWIHPEFSDELRAARRPKLKSLAEEALEEVGAFEGMGTCNIDIIRRALERLQELEEQGDG